jgi:hypothetical protein
LFGRSLASYRIKRWNGCLISTCLSWDWDSDPPTQLQFLPHVFPAQPKTNDAALAT